MQSIITALNAIAPLSSPLQTHLLEKLKTKHFLKREYLLRAGTVCKHIWFIEKGLVRCFYDKNDREVCSWFMKENDVIIAVGSFIRQVKSRESIQALQDTLVHYISYDELQVIYKEFPEFNLHRSLILEKYYVQAEERLFAMRDMTAMEKYQYVMEYESELVLRVSNNDLASYLGMSFETLSRMKNS